MKGLPKNLTYDFPEGFAKRAEPGQGRRRRADKPPKGVTRPGRRLPVHPHAIAATIRFEQAQERRRRGEKIEFACSRCGKPTNSGVARGSLCVDCWVGDELEDDRQLYIATTVRMARESAKGHDTRKLFAQAMRVHDRMLRRLQQVGVSEDESKRFVEKLLAQAQAKGGRIVVPQMGELLQRLGVKVEK